MIYNPWLIPILYFATAALSHYGWARDTSHSAFIFSTIPRWVCTEVSRHTACLHQRPGNSLIYAKLEAFKHSHWWITSHSLWFLSDCNLQFTISLAWGFQAWQRCILISAFLFVLLRLFGYVRELLIHCLTNTEACKALLDHLHLLCLIDHTNSANAHRSANENITYLSPAALSQNRNRKIHCAIVIYTHKCVQYPFYHLNWKRNPCLL